MTTTPSASEVSAILAEDLDLLAETIRAAKVLHTRSGLAIGEALHKAHLVLKKEATWTQWVKDNCEFSVRTAYNYMWSYRHFAGVEGRIDATAMYALVAPGVPQEAREEAKRLAETGTTVTLEQATAIIDTYKRQGREVRQVERKVARQIEETGESFEERERKFNDFLDQAERASQLPPIDTEGIEELPSHEAAGVLFNKALDTIYRLVRLTDDIHDHVPNTPIREAVQVQLQLAVDDLLLWRRAWER
jgi:hypothetical protein